MSTWETFGAQFPKTEDEQRIKKIQKRILSSSNKRHRTYFDLDELTKEDRKGLRKNGFIVKRAPDADNDLCWIVSRRLKKMST